MLHIPRAFWLVLACAVPAGAADQEVVQFWNGSQRVTLALALDELDVVASDPAAVERLQRAIPGAKVEAGKRTPLRFTASDRMVLNQRGAAALALGNAPRAVLYPGHLAHTAQRRQVLTERLAVRLRPGQDIATLAAKHGLEVVERVAYSPDTWIARASLSEDMTAALVIANRIHDGDDVVFATPLIERAMTLRGTPGDPLFAQQWHLLNGGQVGGAANIGNDLNVTPVWNFVNGTGLGAGINIAVVDSGVQVGHPDLVANCRTDIDTDLNGNDGDPSPQSNPEYHGTAVAGVAAARDGNGIGGVGVAPRAGIVGVRLTAANFDANTEGRAVTWQSVPANAADRVHINTNSWGPADDGATLDGPPALAIAARVTGTTSGRGGKGIVYLWAGGNGDADGDDSNYDGYANSPYVIAVAASRPDGFAASYSEGGANIFIDAPGGDGGAGIVTTDMTGAAGSVGGDYFAIADNLAGTSFATPAVAGVVALILEANPRLTWRDVKHLLARTATKSAASSSFWIDNHAVPARHWNRYHGFGRADANAAVTAARTWINAPAEASVITAGESPSVAIPDAGTVSRTCSVTGAPTGFRAEVVELHVVISHANRGQLSFRLTSPLGTAVDIPSRPNDTAADFDWTFTSVATWGEAPSGSWTLAVHDEVAGVTGTLGSWSLAIHGYVPHAAPVFTSVTPSRLGQDGATTTILVTGSGFLDGVTRVRWAGSDLATTWISGTQISAVVPAALLTTPGTVAVTAVNPDFDNGPDHVAGTGGTVVIDGHPTFTSIPPTAILTEDASSAPLAITIADDFTAVGSLTLSASSGNTAVIADSGLVLGGANANRTLTITPVPDANTAISGPVMVTLTLGDGYSTSTAIIAVTVTAANDPPVAFGGRFRTAAATVLNDAVSGFDPDGDAVTFALVTAPDAAAGTISLAAVGTFTFTPAAGFRGLAVFGFKAIANGLESPETQGFITVAGDPNGTRPLIVSEPPDEQIVVSVPNGFTYPIVVDTRRYVVAPTLIYELAGAPAGMTLAGATITWTATGSDRHLSFGILVKDSLTGALDTQTVVLRIVAASATN